MANEWNLYEVRPVGRGQLVAAAARVADRLLGESVLDFSESLMSVLNADCSDVFESQVYATHDGFGAVAGVAVRPLIEDSGEIADCGLLFATVYSNRTLLSSCLGLVVALSWLGEGGGELHGPALDRVAHEDDVTRLVERFRQTEYSGRRRVERLARVAVGERAQMEFA